MLESKQVTDNITIFLPQKYNSTKSSGYLYGKCVQHEQTTKFFIVSDKEHQQLELVASIDETSVHSPESLRNVVRFTAADLNYSDGLKVKELIVEGVALEKKEEVGSVYLICYNGLEHIDSKFKTVNISSEQKYDVIFLATLLDLIKTNQQTLTQELWQKVRQFVFFYFMTAYNVCAWSLMPLRPLLRHTAVFRHFQNWIVCIKSYSFDDGKAWTLIFDISAGILALTLLLKLGNPGAYLMQFTQLVVNNLKSLLVSLKGSPVGLKLNVLLNHFFLNCFIYHVELWHTFLKVGHNKKVLDLVVH